MKKNSPGFSMEDAYRLAQTDAGKQLIALLQSQNSDTIQQAMSQANAGDTVQAQQTLSQLLHSPQIQALVEQLRRDSHG
ncbi:MAG: hypothetical protein IJW45_01585 [Oscillospiraceae bacterium]|nr:hypothetical protein [Oscillospiraceae bacterium]